ncbi:arginine--tRNA ligase, partial [Candidatus Woesearchaeota archaeon]|nr:arginine--tRNA ligase [Candidatus Woesearchaeota archaeon]
LRQLLDRLLVYSKQDAQGDISLPCFELRDHYEVQNPAQAAGNVMQALQENLPDHISVTQAGPFVNFRIDQDHLANTTLETILQQQDSYGSTDTFEGQTAIVEFSSPNYGKPLHVGHIRSTLVGDVLARMFEAVGYNTIRMNYPGDVGGHMGKVIVGINEWNKGELPDDPQQAMEFMKTVYTEYEKAVPSGKEGDFLKIDLLPQAEKERAHRLKAAAAEVNQQIERGDEPTAGLWKRVCELSQLQHAEIYRKLDVGFDQIQRASSATVRGKAIVVEAQEQGHVSEAPDGALSADFGKGVGFVKFLAADGTAVYGTLDVGAAVTRMEDYGFDRMVYVVGSEQAPYFQKLFGLFGRMGYTDVAERAQHLSTGHLVLTKGKMSSRQGNVELLDDVLGAVQEHAYGFLEERASSRGESLDPEQATAIAETVGLGALKYLIHSADPSSKITYDRKRAMSLSGKSAPFAQYTYTRAASILAKNEDYDQDQFDPTHLDTEQEQTLVKRMAEFPVVLESAARSSKPHFITDYIHRLASAFNAFYTNVQVSKEEDAAIKNSKLVLVDAYRHTMQNALGVLGIQTLEKM